MKNVMNIEGHIAVITFDPELNRFRGGFTGLNGGADFYADGVSLNQWVRQALERETQV